MDSSDMGKLGRAKNSDAQKKASRENGKKGGRPRGPNFKPRNRTWKKKKE